MQAAALISITPSPILLAPNRVFVSKNTPMLVSSSPRLGCRYPSTRLSIRAVAAFDTTNSTVDYSSMVSVFPAEACETIGGDACGADIYPEVKLPAAAAKAQNDSPTELIDREYVDYNQYAKTVFCAEACDDLGGEFCSREYQRGVY